MKVSHVTVLTVLLATAVIVGIVGAMSAFYRDTGNGLDQFKDVHGGEAVFMRQGRDVTALVRFGEQLVATPRAGLACQNCHRLPGSNAVTGPSLYGVGERYTKVLGDPGRARIWIYNKIHDAPSFPGFSGSGGMPPMQELFIDPEIEAIVEYLMTLKEE